MSRKVLEDVRIHPAIRERMGKFHADVVAQVQAAIAANTVVVVGMRQNPFPRKARKLLDSLGTQYTYLEYGSYLSEWKPRLALKMWSGWPTFPMIFVNGTLIGGFTDLQRLADSGEWTALSAPRLPA
ncbi:glutaredoxin [Pseudoduganella sp. RAF53_2]|jgi:glutaredoxin-related protein|uniref:glutaredoxin n=1 Tax=unclassified Pseudoduganella TaxID=2637179 RepID=UPI003F98FCA0